MSYAVVDVSTGEVLAVSNRLPFSPSPPGKPKGRLASFSAVGQEAEGYRLVNRVIVDERPSGYHSLGDATTQWNGTEIVVTQRYVAPSLDSVRAARIAEIKAKASDLILSAYPSWKQVNMIARQGELLRIENGLMRNESGEVLEARAMTQGETAELAYISAVWGWIKSVRSHSDALEAEVAACETVQATIAWQGHDWPEDAP